MQENSIERDEIRHPINDYESPKTLNRFAAVVLDLALYVLLSFLILTLAGIIVNKSGGRYHSANNLISNHIKYSKLAKDGEKNGYVSYSSSDLFSLEENEPLIVRRLSYFYLSYLTGENVDDHYEASLNKDDYIKVDGISYLPKEYYNVQFFNEKVLQIKEQKEGQEFFKYQQTDGHDDETKIAVLDEAYIEETTVNDVTTKKIKSASGLIKLFNNIYDEAIKVCPDGWRLPDTTEWNALLYGTVGDIAVVGIDAVGRNIRSKSGWLEQGTGGGDATDALGFSVLPGGSGDSSSYNGKGYNASFWTATSYNDLHGYDFGVGNRNAFGFSIENKGYFESVRCLKGKTIGVSSSSSSAVSSSSVTIPISALCKTEVVDACKYGTLIDDRDGQTYKTVKIGEQWWMAENLNYADSVKTPSLLGNSWCYNNNAAMCNKYGRLYTWMAAIDSVKLATDSMNPQNCGYNITCSLPAQAQGICPNGWHLPDTTDWKTLIETVGDWSNAGKALKSVTGWLYFESVDSYGFSALPGGFLYRSGTFDVEGSTAYLWVATENTSKAFYAYSIVLAGDGIDSFSDGFKDNGYSIRCIKD